MALFLACYSHYLAGEKLKDQTAAEANYSNQNIEIENAKKDSQPSNGSKKNKKKVPMVDVVGNESFESRSRNSHLRDIFLDLVPLYYGEDDEQGYDGQKHGNDKMDGFLLYIFGVVVKNLHQEDGIPNYNTSSQSGLRSSSNSSQDSIFRPQRKSTVPNARQIFIESLRIYPWNWYDIRTYVAIHFYIVINF